MNNLEEAGSLLENGWCRFEMERDGKHCSAGAIAHVLGLEEEEMFFANLDGLREVQELAKEIRESKPHFMQEWYEQQVAARRNMNLPFLYFEEWVATLKPSSIVTHWNDSHEPHELPDILETFKYAAKRLDKE